MTGGERARIMRRVGDLIEANLEELATIEALEVGKAISQARGEMGFSATLWHYAAGHAQGLEGETHNDMGANTLGLVLREPAGVVGIITPWNFPLLIGSEALKRFDALVDPSLKYAAGKPGCATDANSDE